MGLITFWAHQTPEQWCPRSMGHHQGTGPEKSFCSCKSSRFSNIFHCHVGSKNRSYVAIRDVTPFWRGIFGPYAYGSIPIHTIFRGMNIHLPAILMFTRGIGFWPIPIYQHHEIQSTFHGSSKHATRSNARDDGPKRIGYERKPKLMAL
jgi:hypothetical protein